MSGGNPAKIPHLRSRSMFFLDSASQWVSLLPLTTTSRYVSIREASRIRSAMANPWGQTFSAFE